MPTIKEVEEMEKVAHELATALKLATSALKLIAKGEANHPQELSTTVLRGIVQILKTDE